MWSSSGGWGGSLNDFNFGTFFGYFPNVSAASMAIKGLNKHLLFINVHSVIGSHSFLLDLVQVMGRVVLTPRELATMSSCLELVD